ncbi:MAG: hypothetical protein WCA35_16170 [Kovacikia sp.]
MSEVIESTATVQSNEEPDSDFNDFETFSELFEDEDPTEQQKIIDSLLASSEG